jgi:hypothetical protein
VDSVGCAAVALQSTLRPGRSRAVPQRSNLALARGISASARLHAAVVERRLQLPDDDELQLHAANTIARHGRRGWRLDKPDDRTPNDAIIALCMAVESAENQPEPVRVLGFV